MSTYKFDQFKIQINAPTVTMFRFLDNMDGTGTVSVLLTLGAAPGNTQFMVDFDGFTYVGEPTHADIETWALAELIQYEI